MSKGPMNLETGKERKKSTEGAVQSTQTEPSAATPPMAMEPGSPDPAGAAASATVPPMPRVSQQGTPVCGKHNVVMLATTSGPQLTHYKCQVEGCEEVSKVNRMRSSAFAKPMYCPAALCRAGANGKDNPPIALEVDTRLTHTVQITMACPKCKFSISVPNPVLARTQPDRRPASDDLGQR